MSTKAEIRNAALKRRDSIAAAERTAFAARLATMMPDLVGEFVRLPDPLVSLYSPIGSEPDVGPLAAVLHQRGRRLALPVDWSSGTPLVYRAWRPGDRLASGPLGIAEPLDGQPSFDPDVLITPLAAFDRRGHRVGYGVGNVDRTVAALRARKPIVVIGVAFAIQEELLLPSEPHDQNLDIVVTEREVVNCLV